MAGSTGTKKMFASCDGATPEQWELVAKNMGLVYRIVNKRYWRTEDDRDDATQDGMFGLLRAVQKFDPSMGFTLATYAEAWIRQAIHRGMQNRLGANYRAAVRNGTNYVEPVSIDVTYGEDDEFTLLDAISDSSPDIESLIVSQDIVRHVFEQCDDWIDVCIASGRLQGWTFERITRATGDAITREAVRRRWTKLRVRAQWYEDQPVNESSAGAGSGTTNTSI